jgi:hypothetical protein
MVVIEMSACAKQPAILPGLSEEQADEQAEVQPEQRQQAQRELRMGSRARPLQVLRVQVTRPDLLQMARRASA